MQTRSGPKRIREQADLLAPKYQSEPAYIFHIKKKKSKPIAPNVTQEDTEDVVIRPTKKSKPSAPKEDAPIEKRLKMFRSRPPKSYLQRLDRALSQRMCVLSRTRQESETDPKEIVELAGTTGNVYAVTIAKLPSCTCPDGAKGNQCKHIIYVMVNVLRAPPTLQYQCALTSAELTLIFASAPLLPSPPLQQETATPNNRKEIEGVCPICFTDFVPDTDAIIWCKASCGQNVHQECFEQWAKSKKGKEVGCVYCRAPWESDKNAVNIARKEAGSVNREGYVNVGRQLGMSGARDYSTYHQPWVRRNFGGYDVGYL